METLKRMPVGVQSFEIIRTSPYVYVDKTCLIPRLEKAGGAYFLSRPRRFGKSLFISTLEAYFKGRKELFEGLFIEKFKAEHGEEWENYPVLKIDLSAQKYTNEESLNIILNHYLQTWCADHKIQVSSPAPQIGFENVIKSLYDREKKRVVILIDEYDSPLLATLDNEPLHDQYRKTLKAFYGVIKKMNEYIHLSFITGVTKFSKVSIFSDLNNLDDISIDGNYSSICGITEEELHANFAFYVEALASKYGNSYDEMLNILRRKYDGYRFSEKEEKIYNPFSLLSTFEKKKLLNYWFATGTPTFMIHLFEQNYFKIPDLNENVPLSLRILDNYRVDYKNIAPLLYQTGYLTIKKYDEELNSLIVGLPNDEVRYAFFGNLMDVHMTCDAESYGVFMIDEFLHGMRAGDIERVLTLIKSLMASIPYDSLPPDKLFLREHNYQTTIYLIFTLMGQYTRSEVHSSAGRSDVEVETSDGIYIFEFKVGGIPSDAIAQIKASGYATKHEASGKSVFLVGVVVNPDERTLAEWVIEKVR